VTKPVTIVAGYCPCSGVVGKFPMVAEGLLPLVWQEQDNVTRC
jgi:hypothetical protein